MKKFFYFTMCVLIALPLSACGFKKDAIRAQYAHSITKVTELTSTDIRADIKTTTTSSAGQSNDTKISANIKTILKDADLKMQMRAITDSMGQKIDMQAYYLDGYFYMDYFGRKIKTVMDLQTAMHQTKNYTGGLGQNQFIPVDMLENFTLVENENDYTINATVKKDLLDECVEELLVGKDGYSLQQYAFKGRRIDASVTVDNESGYVTSYTLNADYDTTAQGQTINTKTNAVFNILNKDKKSVELEFPKDLELYEETKLP